MFNKIKCILYTCLILIFSNSCAQSTTSIKDLEGEFISLTNEYLKINEEASGAMVAIDHPDKPLWKFSTGFIGHAKKDQLIGEELFIAASITKTFVAVCILQLEEEGKLHITDKVSQYLDRKLLKKLTEYKGKSYEDKLTIAHLLRHTSGIFDYLNEGQVHLEGYKKSPDRTYELQERVDFALELGSATNKLGKYAYSNTNYILLGMILEKVDKKSIADVISDRIIKPLNLKNTSLNPSNDVLPKMFKGYYTDWDLTSFTLHFNKMNPAGGLLTTADDLLVFGRNLFQGRLFKSKSTLEKMLDFDKGYGLGVMQFDKSRKTGRIMGHSGFDPGYTTYLAHIEALNTTVVTVINQSELRVKMPAFLVVKTVESIKKTL
ncbi:serine hydrolase domain-containing protein [Flagellimonas sp.]|uniref:serine hydrolase domain-containing protein n=1 Tax=Flagellimonas sp. TaxID=2058762 RepID=UPI003B59C26F